MANTFNHLGNTSSSRKGLKKGRYHIDEEGNNI